jgi:type IV pilus assembly protein PilA
MGERNYRGWQGEAGFTLIELMVVVLIMGILMAIGIPSFLSTRVSAEEASAKSNATNALTNEKSYFVNNGAFEDLTGGNGAGSEAMAIDDTLPWSGSAKAGPGQVTAIAGTLSGGGFSQVSPAGGDGPAVLIEAGVKNSAECYYIFDYEESSSSPAVAIVGYAESDYSGGCLGLDVAPPSGQPAGGNASAHVETGASLSSGDWYAGW